MRNNRSDPRLCRFGAIGGAPNPEPPHECRGEPERELIGLVSAP